MSRRFFFAVAAAVAAGGCASFPEESGFGPVREFARERTGREIVWQKSAEDAARVRAAVRERLARPLSADDAVEIALLANPSLQATYDELGIAAADLVQAASGPNLRLHRLRTTFGAEVSKVEESFGFDFLGLLLLPLRQRMEARRFERVQAEVSAEALRTALQARRAWIEAVAAAEALRNAERALDSAEAAAELGRRMAAVGNWPKLAHLREQAFYAEVAAQRARAEHAASAARERLARLLGLWGEDLGALKIPAELPEPPEATSAPEDLERRAIEQRLDIRAARRELDWLAESLGLARSTRFVNALEFARARTREGHDPAAWGYAIGLEIPIFDWGKARLARAESAYRQAVQRLADTAVQARSEVREAYAAYRSAFELARHYRDEVLPLRKRISEEVLLRYNGMLASVFELFADAREQAAALAAYVGAKREFWLAEAELAASLSGKTTPHPVRPGAPALAAPAAAPAH